MLLECSFTGRGASLRVLDLARWEARGDPGHQQVFLPRFSDASDPSSISLSGERLVVRRAFSGEQPLYWAISGATLVVGDRVADVAARVGSSIDIEGCYSYIYFEYPGPARTLYSGVAELLNAQVLSVGTDGAGRLTVMPTDHFAIPSDEMHSDEHALSAALRKNITEALRRRARANNGVLMSGGIDSQVMGIALTRDLGLRNVFAAHFHVAGAQQSEREQAHQATRQLDMEWILVEVDPAKAVDWQSIVRKNNPYIGALSMGAVMSKVGTDAGGDTTLFAGQDTRLHTPALSRIDLLLWNTLYRAKMGGMAALIGRSGYALLKPRPERYLARLLEFARNSGTFEDFVANRTFHVRRLGFNDHDAEFSRIYSNIVRDLAGIKPGDKRHSYNRIVAANWRRQYLFDIGYMVESCEDGGANCAMPFYDRDLVNLSARLPFALATRFVTGRAGHAAKAVTVNKYLLRKAYEGDLDRDLIFRDKAVCKTSHMFLNGGLRQLLREFCADRQIVTSPDGMALHLPQLAEICRRKDGQWEPSDSWLCNLVFNAMVVFTLMKSGPGRPAEQL